MGAAKPERYGSHSSPPTGAAGWPMGPSVSPVVAGNVLRVLVSRSAAFKTSVSWDAYSGRVHSESALICPWSKLQDRPFHCAFVRFSRG
eukprot:2773561-Pyramimonas_sp.AAC.1